MGTVNYRQPCPSCQPPQLGTADSLPKREVSGNPPRSHPLATALFSRRAAQGALRPEVLEFILSFGTEWHVGGALHLTVLDRALPPGLRDTTMADRARGWVVVLIAAPGQRRTLLTCYRAAAPSRRLRRRRKWHRDRRGPVSEAIVCRVLSNLLTAADCGSGGGVA